MVRIPTIELDELYAKYELHPHLMDLYVEGEFDRDFINCFLQHRGLAATVSVITIDEIEIPKETLLENSLPLGSNKNSLIALALLLQRRLSKLSTNVSCIVDTDQDRVLNKVMSVRHLLYTDYSSMEMYCLNDITLKKFINLACNLSDDALPRFGSLASTVLPTKFCLRALNEKLSLMARTPPFSSGLTDARALPSFDQARYISAFIGMNELHQRSEEIRVAFAGLYRDLPTDLRDKSHGHDFVELLFEYATKSGSFMLQDKNNAVPKYGGRLLASMIDVAQVFGEALFAKIEATLKARAFMWVAP